jgi:hypothetical protein
MQSQGAVGGQFKRHAIDVVIGLPYLIVKTCVDGTIKLAHIAPVFPRHRALHQDVD